MSFSVAPGLNCSQKARTKCLSVVSIMCWSTKCISLSLVNDEGSAVAFFRAVYWMHLHKSFDDGGSPSSTKRQSSASTSWAWIILSTVCLVWGGAARLCSVLFRSGAGAASCAVCRAARLGGPSPKAALRKGCVWLPSAEGLFAFGGGGVGGASN